MHLQGRCIQRLWYIDGYSVHHKPNTGKVDRDQQATNMFWAATYRQETHDLCKGTVSAQSTTVFNPGAYKGSRRDHVTLT